MEQPDMPVENTDEERPATETNAETNDCTQTTETAESNETAETSTPPPDIEEMLRQAYLRGRNEAIEALMERPGMMQPLSIPPGKSTPRAEPEVMILNNPRPSIWDK